MAGWLVTWLCHFILVGDSGWLVAGLLPGCVILYWLGIGWGLVGDLAGWPVVGWLVTWLCHFILDGD